MEQQLCRQRNKAIQLKKVEGIEIKAKPDEPVAVTRQGNLVTPTFVDTTVAVPTASKVRVGATELDLTTSELGDIPSGWNGIRNRNVC